MTKLKPHRIAIIGATGDLGSCFMRHCLDRGFSVTALMRSEGKNFPKLINSEQCEVVILNRRTRYELPLAALTKDSKCVVNFAGELQRKAARDSHYVTNLITNNVLFPSLVSAFCAKRNIPLVHLSSESVAGVQHHPHLTRLMSGFEAFFTSLATPDVFEYSPSGLTKIARTLLPQLREFHGPCGYALSKLIGEHYGFSANRYLVARLSNVYGPGFGRDRLVGRLMSARIQGRVLHVADESRDFLYVDDFCHAMLELTSVVDRLDPSVVWVRSGSSLRASHIASRIEALLPQYYGRVQCSKRAGSTKELATPRQRRLKALPYRNFELHELVRFCPTPFRQGLDKTIESFETELVVTTRVPRERFRIPQGETHRRKLYGGSVAGKWLVVARAPKNRRFVRKIATTWGVGGSGIPKLRAEAAFYSFLRGNSEMRPLSKLYPKVLRTLNSTALSVLEMEYIGDGRNLAQYLAAGGTLDPSSLDQLLTVLLRNGYQIGRVRLHPEESSDRLTSLYIRRPISRLRFTLEKMLSRTPNVKLETALRAPVLTINGIPCQNPTALLSRFREFQLWELLRPRIAGFCAHGDLTILNMVMDDRGTLRLIDPRGYVGRWDPLYDFGKLWFSLTGFANVMLGSFKVTKESEDGFTISCTPVESMLELKAHVEEALKTNRHFRWISREEPFWPSRIRFAAATHYLADVPYRLLADIDNDSALGVYLLGTLLLNDLVK